MAPAAFLVPPCPTVPYSLLPLSSCSSCLRGWEQLLVPPPAAPCHGHRTHPSCCFQVEAPLDTGKGSENPNAWGLAPLLQTVAFLGFFRWPFLVALFYFFIFDLSPLTFFPPLPSFLSHFILFLSLFLFLAFIIFSFFSCPFSCSLFHPYFRPFFTFLSDPSPFFLSRPFGLSSFSPFLLYFSFLPFCSFFFLFFSFPFPSPPFFFFLPPLLLSHPFSPPPFFPLSKPFGRPGAAPQPRALASPLHDAPASAGGGPRGHPGQARPGPARGGAVPGRCRAGSGGPGGRKAAGAGPGQLRRRSP